MGNQFEKGYIKALKSSDASVREKAVLAAHYSKDEKAVDLILESLKDADKIVRLRAIQILGYYNRSEVIEALLRILNSEDSEMQCQAVASLGKLGDKSVSSFLIPLLYHKDEKVADIAAKTLASFGDERAVEPLIQLIGKRKLTKSFLDALVKFGDRRAVEPLLNSLNSSDAVTKTLLAETLGEFRDERAVEPLIELLKEFAGPGYKSGFVSDALIKFGVLVIPKIIPLLDSDNEYLRIYAACILSNLIDTTIIEPLLRVAKKEEEQFWVRIYAIKGLGQVGDVRVLKILFEIKQKTLNTSLRDEIDRSITLIEMRQNK